MNKTSLARQLILCLGSSCTPRYQISRVLFERQITDAGPFYLGHPRLNELGLASCFFDWSITPFGSLTSLLRNDFQGVLLIENLQVRKTADGKSMIFDQGTGISYPHLIDENLHPLRCEEDIVPFYGEIASKASTLIENTRTILRSKEQSLYVYCDACDPENLLYLTKVLDAWSDNYQLLFVHTPEDTSAGCNQPDLPEKVIYQRLPLRAYPGVDSEWNQLFDSLI
ncbi:MAG: hypothetical protein KDD62_04885 [Bdellovibrionales bacterium]|nr:hypothetical protein [Bdellovibrionales bacterium]